MDIPFFYSLAALGVILRKFFSSHHFDNIKETQIYCDACDAYIQW